MFAAEKEQYTQLKLAQLCRSRYTNSSDHYKNIINHILEEDFDINYLFTVKDGPLSEKTTALHHAYLPLRRIELFEMLLDRKADFTIRNGKGQTVLHFITQEYLNGSTNKLAPWNLRFFNAILSAHVKFNKSVNPKSENGISHFHAACIVNHTAAVELFLQNGTSVDEAVDVHSSYYAGYSGLHFAVKFSSYDVVKLLLKYGANLHAMCAKGLTPIHLLLQQRIKLFNMQHGVISKFLYGKEKLIKDIPRNEKILKVILKNNSSLITDLSDFHIACTLNDSSIAESLFEYVTDVNHCVSNSSPVFQKFTALHFAALCNVNTVKFLLRKGASMLLEDDCANVPLDLCIQRYDTTDIQYILSQHPIWKNIVLSNGQTMLTDVILLMKRASNFSIFLTKNIEDVNMFIPFDSPLWPGYTLLHLIVLFSSENKYNCSMVDEALIVQKILKCSYVNCNIQDARGQTPIHLAFRQKKRQLTKHLLGRLNRCDDIVNLVDEDNLSYLHIACAVNDDKVVLKLLKTSDLNIIYKGNKSLPIIDRLDYSIHPGWTPLHISVFLKKLSIVKMLINQGANINTADMEGLTPVHWLLNNNYDSDESSHKKTSNFLFASLKGQDCIASKFGLNYLHVACFTNNETAVKKLLKVKVSPFMKICYNESTNGSQDRGKKRPSSFLAEYDNYTPFSFAIIDHENYRREIVNSILGNGGDKLLTNVEEKILLNNYKYRRNRILMCMIKDNSQIQKIMEERFGLKLHHIACYLAEYELIQALLNQGADANAQVKSDSPFFPAYTSLHMCFTTYKGFLSDYNEKVVLIIDLLLKHGADVNLANSKGDTPILAAYNHGTIGIDAFKSKMITKLFQYNRDFSVNPSNNEISHFHVACLIHDLDVIKKFLQRGQININQPINNLQPLNLALKCYSEESSMQLSVIYLLLDHGSDVHSRDTNGTTPLHKAAKINDHKTRLQIIEKLIAHGACMNLENLEGITPFEILLKNNISIQEIEFLKNCGCRVAQFNRYSQEGHIGKFLTSYYENEQEKKSILKELIEFLDVAGINDTNSTAIHNAVAVSVDRDSQISVEIYQVVLTYLLNMNYGIDKQDNSGKTALYYAVQFGNKKGVAALLQLGADVNIIDKSGKLALSYSVERCTIKNPLNRLDCTFCDITSILMKHVKKLQHFDLEVNKLYSQIENDDLKKPHMKNCTYAINRKLISHEVEKTKNIHFGFGPHNLHGFLLKTGTINIYPYLNLSNRDSIKCVFNSISQMKFQQIEGILNFQFNEAVSRLAWVDQATNRLRILLGFSFPGLCEEIIMYLTNSDLKALIASNV